MGRFCTHCGTEFSEGALFCRNCGARRSDSESPASSAAIKPAQPQSPSEKIVPLVFEELKKSGPLPNYTKLTQVLEKLKKEDNNPVVEALSEIVASYKHIGKMYELLAKPETLTSESVRANALAGLGIFPAVGSGTAALAGASAGLGEVATGGAGFGGPGNGNGIKGGQNGSFGGRPGTSGGQGYIDTTATPVRHGTSNSGSGSRWGQYLGMAAAGFAGAMLADSLHSAMSTPHYTEGAFSSPLGFGGEQSSLDQYLQGDTSDSFFSGDSMVSGASNFFGGGTADASDVTTTDASDVETMDTSVADAAANGVGATDSDSMTGTDSMADSSTLDNPAAFDDPNGPIDSSDTTYDTAADTDPLASYVDTDASADASDATVDTDGGTFFDDVDNIDTVDDSFFDGSDSFFGGSDSFDDPDDGFFGGGGFFDDGGDDW